MWYTHQYIMERWALGPAATAVAVALVAAFVIAVIALKGYCLWHAAKRGEKWWFFFLFIVNTAGILELVYIFAILKERPWRRRFSQDS